MSGLVNAPVMPALGGSAGVVRREINMGDEVRYEVETDAGKEVMTRDDFEILTAGEADLRGLDIRYLDEIDTSKFFNCEGNQEYVHIPQKVKFFPVSVSRVPSGYCTVCNTYFFGPMES